MPEAAHPDAEHPDGRLLAALAGIQQRGAIGDVSLPASVAHADQFVRQLPPRVRRLADLGSGGGLPGLVIAFRRPEIAITLVERRRTRADLLQRAVSALQLINVQVFGSDVRRLAISHAGSFDAVTARSFAASAVTARWAGELLVTGGLLVVSEPPATPPERWSPTILRSAGLIDLGQDGGIRRFQRVALNEMGT